MSDRKRGIICAYCGMAWGYEDESPTPDLIKEACDHESVCEKNPYTAQIRDLRRERDEARKQLRVAVGLLSTTPQFQDQHPEEVLKFVEEDAK